MSLKYVQENNMSHGAIFGELPVDLPTVGDSRWFKVMISLRFKLPVITVTDIH